LRGIGGLEDWWFGGQVGLGWGWVGEVVGGRRGEGGVREG